MRAKRALTALTVTALLGAALLVGTWSSSTSSATAGVDQSNSSILASVLKSGVLRVGTITGNAPFESLNAHGQLQGYDIDIVKKLAQALGVKIDWIQTDVAGRVTVLETGKADVVVGSFTRNEDRSKVVAFTDPINLEYVALITRAGSKLSKLGDYNKSSVKIALATGGTQATAVPQALPKAKTVLLPGIGDEINALVTGKVDAAAIANTQAPILMKQFKGKLKLVPGALTAEQEDGLGLPQGDFTWWLYLNQFVHDINSDGTTLTLYHKWFGPGASPGPFALPPAGSTH